MYLLLELAFVSLLIFFANCQDRYSMTIFSWLIAIQLLIIIAYMLLMGLSVFYDETPLYWNFIGQSANPVFFVLNLLLVFESFQIAFNVRHREFLQNYIFRSNGKAGHYQADSTVHTVAIIIALFLCIASIGSLVIGGGLEGMAVRVGSDSLRERVLSQYTSLGTNVLLAFLGIGFLVRRNLSASLERLGLGANITFKSLLIGIIIGLLSYALAYGFIWLLEWLLPTETNNAHRVASWALFSIYH